MSPRGAGQYAALAGVTDPKLRASIKLLLDRITVLERQAQGIGSVTTALSSPLDAGGNLVQQVQDPQAGTDAVNLRTLQQYVEGILTGTLTAPPTRPAPRGSASTGGGGSVTVPSVVGLTQALATSTLIHGFLVLGSVTLAASTTVAAGIVLGQSPASGSLVTSGSAVNLVVSSGSPGAGAVPVPNVVGLTQAAATTAITGAGLVVAAVSLENSTSPAGTVLAETPIAGTLVALGSGVAITVAIVSPSPGSGNIRVSGKTFRNPDGSIYPWRSATDFRLLQYYYDGVDIGPICADRTGEGANMVRVLGMYAPPIGLFDPSTYPNYYVNLPGFARFLAARGLNLEFVVFASAQDLPQFNEFSEQVTHLNQVVAQLSPEPNVVLELCNEAFQNGVTPSAHTQPTTIICAAGSGMDETPDLPPWDYATFHAPRDAEWPRKSHNAMEIANYLDRPVINDEPMGAAEVAVAGSRSDVPDDFYYFAAIGMLLAGGGTFHSSNGVQSQIWEPVQRLCAQSFYAALNAIPLDLTTSTYTRGPFADLPIQYDETLVLRTYARYNAHTAVVVAVRPAAGWVAIAQGGWTITSQTGPHGCVVYLSR